MQVPTSAVRDSSSKILPQVVQKPVGALGVVLLDVAADVSYVVGGMHTTPARQLAR